MIPDRNITTDGQLSLQKFTITAEIVKQKMLPGDFPPTTLYVYSGLTEKGQVSAFPGPAIVAQKGVPITIKYVNNLKGKHMLPVDIKDPFLSDPVFLNEIPMVPHAHGLATKQSSDGEPMAYWTASGNKSKEYETEEECAPNEAVYIYAN